MHKIFIEVKQNKLSFSLYTSHTKVENLNDTNIVDTEKMIFSDTYINNNLDLIKSFFNLIVVKKNISTIELSVNAIFPLVYRIIDEIPNIKNIILLEDKTISYVIFEYLLKSKYIENVDCYSIPSFMFDKLDIDKNMKINSRCEILFISKFMEKNNCNTYSDVYYKKAIDIDCNMDKTDYEDIESFLRFNNKLRLINLYNVNLKSVEFLLGMLKQYNKKNLKIILYQSKNNKEIIELFNNITSKNKNLIKSNNMSFKINYLKEYRDKNTLKQVNLSFFRLIFLTFLVLTITLAIVYFVRHEKDTDSITDELEEIDKIIDLNKIENYIAEQEQMPKEEEKVEIVEPEEKEQEKEQEKEKPVVDNSPYHRNFSRVFSELLKINNETVGWLKVNETGINYPVTQHNDNSYYLENSFYKEKNIHGWVFMDYRNSAVNLNKNTIIYGHRNNDGVMFATLKNVLDKKWYTNKNNQIITFNTLNQDMQWQIFSIYTLKNTNDYLLVNFDEDDEKYMEFLEKMKSRSIYDFGVELTSEDNILTLSTCYNNAEYRLVVHAKLIKDEEPQDISYES